MMYVCFYHHSLISESLQFHLDAYGRVSNAKIRIDKTDAIFLGECSSDKWIAFLASHHTTLDTLITVSPALLMLSLNLN
jgi:hypothetical protein